MTTLKVALVQFRLQREPSLEHFLHHVEEIVAEAARLEADLVVLPELASTGLLASLGHEVTVATVADDYRHGLASYYEDIVDGLTRFAAMYGLVVVGGSHNRTAEDGSLRNTAVIVHPDGTIHSQDKLHLTPPEHAMGTQGGDDLLLTQIGPFTAGVLICADIQFPELSRWLVDRDVDLIICPSLTWNRRGAHRVRLGCQARAMENQAYVVMSPVVGHSGLPVDGPLYAVGRALAAGPVDKLFGHNDGILVQSDTDEETVLLVDLDLAQLHASRATPETPGLALRRPDLYEQLIASRS